MATSRCASPTRTPRQDGCYNYGVADFQHPVGMAAGFFRGTRSFWVARNRPENMLWVYLHFDRTVLGAAAAARRRAEDQVIGKLEHDILLREPLLRIRPLLGQLHDARARHHR